MFRYILRRIGASIPLLIVISLAVFLLLELTPGDPAVMMLGSDATPEAVKEMRVKMGLDQSLPRQYVSFLAGAVRGDLGNSFETRLPVVQETAKAFRATLQLAAAAMLLSIVIGIPLGIITGILHRSRTDQFMRVVLLLFVSIPSFWLGPLLIAVFAVWLKVLPAFGQRGWSSLILPSLTLSMFTLATNVRMMRSSLIEVLRKDYIRTARAKGLAERVIVMRHSLKNAMIPVVTVMGIQFGTLLTGAAVTETIFVWPGLGRMLVTAVFARDYPMIRAGVLLIAVIFIVINLLVDLIYAALDPRIRYS